MQPVASAGATLEAIWLSGQFHGVISPQTPIGSRRTIPSPSALRTRSSRAPGGFLEMEQRDGRLALGRERDRRAHLQRHHPRQFRQARPKTLDDLLKPGQPLLDAGYGIGRESAARGLGGPVHIRPRAQADLRERLLRCGIDDAELRRRRGIDPGTVNIELQLFHRPSSVTSTLRRKRLTSRSWRPRSRAPIWRARCR